MVVAPLVVAAAPKWAVWMDGIEGVLLDRLLDRGRRTPSLMIDGTMLYALCYIQSLVD